MIQLLLLLHVAVLSPAVAAPVVQPDSIVAQRLVRASPRRVPLVMKREFAAGPTLDAAVKRLQDDGFFQLSADDIAAACGRDAMAGLRVSIRVHENASWRELQIPDTCSGGSPELRRRLASLCADGWALIAGGLHPAQPSTIEACKK